jgi:hypothetical protein
MRAFVHMREMLLSDAKMSTKLQEIEEHIDAQEMNTIIIMDKLRTLSEPEKRSNKQKIGFPDKK